MADLTPIRNVFCENSISTAVSSLYARANDGDYGVLEKGGLVTAFALTKREVRYKITPAGRAVLPV